MNADRSMKYNKGIIYNDDTMNIMKRLPNESIDLIVTDPPYRVTARGNSGNSGGMFQKNINMKGKVFECNDIKPSDYIPEFYRILKDGSHCYIMTNHINLIEILNVAKDCGFHFIKSLVWMKDNKIMGQYYMSQFEYILFFRKGKGKRINNCGTSDILQFPNKKQKGADGKNLHDTEKPVGLMKVLIENSSQENDYVFEPFCGIGAVPMACIQSNRKCISVELDETYYSIARNRILEELNNKQNTTEVGGSHE